MEGQGEMRDSVRASSAETRRRFTGQREARPEQVALLEPGQSWSSTVLEAKLLVRSGETKPRETAVSHEDTPRTLTMP